MEEAKELYEILSQVHPNDSEIKVLLAEILIELDRDQQAIQYLETIPQDDPNYAAVLLIEADLYQMQGLYEVSEQKLLHAKRLFADEPVIQYALGELYMSLGRFKDAIDYYKELLKAGENTLAGNDVNGRLAEALSASGAFEESIGFYERTLDNHVDINTLFGYALTCYQAGQYHKAIKGFTELKEMDPQYNSLYLYLSKSYEQLGSLHEAIKAAEAGFAVDQFNVDLFFHAGRIALEAKEEQSAESYLRESLALDPELTKAAQLLIKLLLHQERYDDVLEIVNQFSNKHAEAQFYWDAAYSYQKIEQYSEALNQYRLAYNEFKNNTEFLSEYGYFLIEEGKRAEAIAIFQRLNELEPWNEEWTDLLARFEEYP